MKTEVQKLQETFNESFAGWSLSAAKAAEWIEEFGLKSCQNAVAIAAEKEPEKPDAYVFVILKEKQKRKSKESDQAKSNGRLRLTAQSDQAQVDHHLREVFVGLIETGDLTGEEVSTLLKARSGKRIEREEWLEAEFRLRKAIYPSSKNWIPRESSFWEQQAYREFSEEARQRVSIREIKEAASEIKERWTNSSEYKRIEKAAGENEKPLEVVVSTALGQTLDNDKEGRNG